MSKTIAAILLLCGIVLLIMGVSVPNVANSYLASLLAESPIDKAIIMLVGGVIATMIGLIELVRRSKN